MSSKDKKIQKNELTTQEYSFKHAIPIETLLNNHSAEEVQKTLQPISNNNPNEEQKNILKAYQDLGLLKLVDSEIHIYEEIRKLDYLYICVGVVIHWEANSDEAIYENNYKATKGAIAAAVNGTPSVDEMLSKKDSTDHPFQGF